jgi:hypothetical protein
MPGRGRAIHQRLGVRERIRVATLDRVRRERERRAAESNQRHFARELATQQANRLEHVAERLARLEPRQPIDIGCGSNRARDRGSFTLDEVERQTHRLEREQQIGKKNRRIHVEHL